MAVGATVQSLSNDSLFLRAVGTLNGGGLPVMSSSGGHAQSSPSPPGHDPRTSSIQALRMRAKEHVESITKGLQMVWRIGRFSTLSTFDRPVNLPPDHYREPDGEQWRPTAIYRACAVILATGTRKSLGRRPRTVFLKCNWWTVKVRRIYQCGDETVSIRQEHSKRKPLASIVRSVMIIPHWSINKSNEI